MGVIADYASLKSAIQTWAVRPDNTFGNQVPMFVEMAESRLYDGASEPGDPLHSGPLRSSIMETTSTITLTDGVGPMPDDALELRKVWVTDGQFGITYTPPERFAELSAQSSGGAPIQFTVEAGTIKVMPRLTGSLDVTYYKRFPGIGPSNTTGPLLTQHGSIYLTAALVEAFTFLQQAQLAGAHLAKLKSMIAGVNRTSSALLLPGLLRIRSRRVIGA